MGRYRVLARLGVGGMGRVFLARSPGGRPVAVKVVRPELAEDAEFRRRFAREVAAARRVNSFFTAGVLDADPEGAPPWLATAYVAGMSLNEAVAAHGPWPEPSVRALGAALAEALEAIHATGLVHRDLKPSNVLLAQDGPRVIDFGISLAVGSTALTLTGAVVGTPGFIAPEQLRDGDASPASDVFSLGAVLGYAAGGTGPFGEGPAQEVNFRAAFEPPRLDEVPPGLRELAGRCLEKDPGRRPSVAELLAELASDTGAGPLTQREWLPAPVSRAVRERTETPLPSTPPAPSPT
ncbi:serine/threonine protein kinase, partial [Streptomyces sp. 8K308]